MADLDRPYELNAAEIEEEERRAREQRATLDEEIARRYEPRRLQRVVLQGAGRGDRLDLSTRSEMERLLPGHDFSRVRVFRGALAEEITARHKADAVTVANTGMILVREGARSAPGTTSGRALIAHELTHVAQAQRGMHFALEHGRGEGAHEEEAEAVERAVGGGDTQSAQTGAANAKAKQEHRNRKVVEKVIEMIAEYGRLSADRFGSR